ncbi:MAG: hypothetical protein NW215_01600 [Hyphomicrobiales bacterium]|nr:hypothetical protein [Hyphomicrobiales bacterium]
MTDMNRDGLWRLIADLRFELLQQRIAAEADPRELCRVNTQTFSQGPEDGVIAEIFRRIGWAGKAPGERTFIEIGVGDGRENATRLLLSLGWSGVWVEGDAENAAAIRRDFAAAIAAGRLRLVEAMATEATIAELLRAAGADERPDVLSIDVDMHTYHIWRGLSGLRPRVAVIEYNASIPAPYEFVVPFDPQSVWDGSNWYGASLKSLELLGRERGMALVGSDAFGVNAFFVAEDEPLDAFVAPFTAERHHRPACYLAPMRWGHWPAKPRVTEAQTR